MNSAKHSDNKRKDAGEQSTEPTEKWAKKSNDVVEGILFFFKEEKLKLNVY
jgi:hypothetical protein